MSLIPRLYVALIFVVGLALGASILPHWESQSLIRYGCYLIAGLLTAGLKVSLPAITGTLSVTFFFTLFGIVEMTLPETLCMACVMKVVQCFWNPVRRPGLVQVAFNVSAVSVATVGTWQCYRSLATHMNSLPGLVAAAVIYFLLNTLLVATLTALSEGKPILAHWRESYFWSFPYYLGGAAIVGLMGVANRYVGWQTALLVIPVVYLIYRSYRLHLGRLESEKKHAQAMAALHLRTIEALALAIETKDHATHDHLERVQVYAVEIGKELQLGDEELEALRAASLLHDIGKLAVPEHIISKPGRLTPEEFDKMKIHPVAGAQILERVQFPYPVVPIVLNHHERWDGSGYPAGLSGERIPIGARILSAVDCLDALASDRQYRRALPLDEAMRQVTLESGKSFDPRVVKILQSRYVELEQKAVAKQDKSSLTIGVISSGVAPAAGFEHVEENGQGDQLDFLQSIAAARQEVQSLFELAQDLGNSLSLDETLSVLAVRLRRMIPCESMAIYVRRENILAPEFVTGDDFRLFSALEIPIGQGLSGWVAEHNKPIVNGNPSVEPGYLNDPGKYSTLKSALAVPLEGLSGVIGVLSLYRAEKDSFTRDHLRILLAISSKVALSVENALRFRQAESLATIDYVTTLPNARSLFVHLDGELARARRAKTPVAILVGDLDGFRQVNAHVGQLEGNKLLRVVALGLKAVCREYDFIARMCGDEFVLILPGLTPENVEARCHPFRRVIAEAGREICGIELEMSIGQAFFPKDGADAEALLAEADRRMYREKQQNRGRKPTENQVRAEECVAATVD